MALIVEDGTGLSNSNSYGTLDEAAIYFADRGKTAWDGLDDDDNKTPALILATDFMLQMYRMRWKGYRTLTTQALDWPRSYAEKPDIIGGGYYGYPNYYGFDEIPNEVKTACFDLAYRQAINGDLAADIAPDDYIKMARVGPISVEYADYRPLVPLFRSVEMKLAPLLVGIPGMAVIGGR